MNKAVVDAWGIPVLHFQANYGDNEFQMAKGAVDIIGEACQGAGFEILNRNGTYSLPGYSIHEPGTCRMGDNANTSVLNK